MLISLLLYIGADIYRGSSQSDGIEILKSLYVVIVAFIVWCWVAACALRVSSISKSSMPISHPQTILNPRHTISVQYSIIDIPSTADLLPVNTDTGSKRDPLLARRELLTEPKVRHERGADIFLRPLLRPFFMQ